MGIRLAAARVLRSSGAGESPPSARSFVSTLPLLPTPSRDGLRPVTDPALRAHIEAARERAAEAMAALEDPAVHADAARIAALGRDLAALRPVLDAADTLDRLDRDLADLDVLDSDADPDPEMAAFVRDERRRLAPLREPLAVRLARLLRPRPPEDRADAIVEIRAGTGGDEAALFAGDLFRLYSRFAERQGWEVDLFDVSEGTMGGVKEVVFALRGNAVYGTMKYESGVHRVQRVPQTESQGRIHTSAATVAVLPEAEEVEIDIRTEDLRVDVYRASGAGGQHVNKTESAVRITHLPTGTVVTCQDERSQFQNRERAMRLLRARLYDARLAEAHDARAATRRALVSTGDRSAKIRTYNVPQDRLTDHRLEGDDKNRPLRAILDGDLAALLTALHDADTDDDGAE